MTTLFRKRLPRRLGAALAACLVGQLAVAPAWAQGKGVPKLAAPAKPKDKPAKPAKPTPAKAPEPAEAPAAGKPDLPGEKEFNQCSKLPPGKRIKLTLKPESELNELLAWISGMTCTQFIVPSTIRSQKVTIISPQPITAAEGYRLFLGALDSVGLTVVPVGGFLKIIETTQAKEGVATFSGNDAPSDSRFITRLIKVRYADIEGVKAVLNALRSSKGGDIQSYAPGRTLIVTDTGANIQRMLGVLQQLDTEGAAEKIWIIKLKRASVSEVASMVGEILGVSATIGTTARKAGQPSAPPAPKPPGMPGAATQEVPSRIIIDERKNQLFIVASEQNYARIRSLVLRLDRGDEAKPDGDSTVDSKINVYKLANADVDEISGTLQGITGIAVSRSSVTRRGLSGSQSVPPPPAPPTGGQPGQKVDSGLFSGEITISADRATNSLVVVSSPGDFLTLRRILERLDVPRKQVFVEASILEVSMDKARNLGLSFHGGAKAGSGSDQSLIIFGSNPAKTIRPDTGILGDPLALQGLAAGAFGPKVDGAGDFIGIPGISIPSFGAFLMAVQQDSDVNVLSSPFITATDNEEAEISVGENIPFVSQVVGGLGATGASPGLGGIGVGTSVQRQDVALKLKLRPHVSEGGFVRLDIDQEISEVAGQTQFGPTTTKRSARTIVTVRDQQTVVIGGLISDKIRDRVSKVPLLGDIPILGYLFKQTEHKIEKRNLIIVLTPYVISDQNDLKRVVERKMRERREFVERYVTADERRDVDATVDYTRRRGLFEEINVTARDVEEENAILERAAASMREEAEQTPVDLPTGGVETTGAKAQPTPPAFQPAPAIKAPPPLKK